MIKLTQDREITPYPWFIQTTMIGGRPLITVMPRSQTLPTDVRYWG